MRIIKTLISLLVGGYFLLVGGMRVYVETYTQVPVNGPVSAIVVLSSGPVRSDLEGRTAVRTRVGTDLYFNLLQAGDNPRLVLSGGRGKAEDMKDIAINQGVPSDVVLIEDRSDSTLQNALFSAQMLRLGTLDRTVVVTDRFHIPRARASFWWAGMSDFIMVAADGEDEPVDWDNLLGEGIKWPVNTIRGIVFSALSSAGWAQEDIYWIIQ